MRATEQRSNVPGYPTWAWPFRRAPSAVLAASAMLALLACGTDREAEDDDTRDTTPDSALDTASDSDDAGAANDTSGPPDDASDGTTPDPDSGAACACGAEGCVEVFGYPIVSSTDGECWDRLGERTLMGCVSSQGAWPEATQCLQSASTGEQYVTLNIYAPLLEQGWSECTNSPPPCP
jgi:hypothetical protein